MKSETAEGSRQIVKLKATLATLPELQVRPLAQHPSVTCLPFRLPCIHLTTPPRTVDTALLCPDWDFLCPAVYPAPGLTPPSVEQHQGLTGSND